MILLMLQIFRVMKMCNMADTCGKGNRSEQWHPEDQLLPSRPGRHQPAPQAPTDDDENLRRVMLKPQQIHAQWWEHDTVRARRLHILTDTRTLKDRLTKQNKKNSTPLAVYFHIYFYFFSFWEGSGQWIRGIIHPTTLINSNTPKI